MQRQANAIRVRVVSDVNCPWCWAGKRSLETAAAATGVPVEATWHPFMLYPDLPAKGVDRSTNLEKKFGPSFRDIMDDMFTRMNRYGVEAKLVPGSRTANTLNAHRLLHYTLTHYSPQLQNQVAEVLFRKVHNEGRFVGDNDELYAAAEEAGFTPSQIQELRTYLEQAFFACAQTPISSHRLGLIPAGGLGRT
eukprot:EG_transcript_28180